MSLGDYVDRHTAVAVGSVHIATIDLSEPSGIAADRYVFVDPGGIMIDLGAVDDEIERLPAVLSDRELLAAATTFVGSLMAFRGRGPTWPSSGASESRRDGGPASTLPPLPAWP